MDGKPCRLCRPRDPRRAHPHNPFLGVEDDQRVCGWQIRTGRLCQAGLRKHRDERRRTRRRQNTPTQETFQFTYNDRSSDPVFANSSCRRPGIPAGLLVAHTPQSVGRRGGHDSVVHKPTPRLPPVALARPHPSPHRRLAPDLSNGISLMWAEGTTGGSSNSWPRPRARPTIANTASGNGPPLGPPTACDIGDRRKELHTARSA
jgi:hypothetical protein